MDLCPHVICLSVLSTLILRYPLQVPAYVLGRVHLLHDPDRTKVLERARIMAFLASLLTLVKGSSLIRVGGHVPRSR